MVWLPDSENGLRIRVTILTEYRRVPDGQTGILRRHKARYAYASRGKNISIFDKYLALLRKSYKIRP